MSNWNERIYLIINSLIIFLILCVLNQLSPLISNLFSLLWKIISPFLFGFILASLIYPVIFRFKITMVKIGIALGIYLGLAFMIMVCLFVTLPQLIKDFTQLIAYFNLDISMFHIPVYNSIQISSGVMLSIFNAIIISFFYLFDEQMVANVYIKIPHRQRIVSYYYDFIEYFYALLMHLICRLLLVLLLMKMIDHPYAVLISLLSLVSLIPILGNLAFYTLLFFVFLYYPIILLPSLLLMLYDIYFYKHHPYHILKMLVIMIGLRLINPYLIIFTIPLYFFVIHPKQYHIV